MVHEIKIHPEPFEAVKSGIKLHEIRVFDRDYKEGDELLMREWSPETEEYTGDQVRCHVSYITPRGAWGLPDNLCVMSIKVYDPNAFEVDPCATIAGG